MTQTMNYGGPNTPSSSGNGLGIASLVCGIIALMIAWIPILNCLAVVIAIVAVGLGIAGIAVTVGKPGRSPAMSIVGTVLGALAVALFFVSYFVLGAVAGNAGGSIMTAGLRQSTAIQADAMAEQAREKGVDEQVITDARADLDAVLDDLSSDIEDTQTNAGNAEAALRDYRRALEDAAGEPLEVEDDPAADAGPEFGAFGTPPTTWPGNGG